MSAEAADFLNADERPAPDPHLLPGMTEAAERVARALRRNEPIGVFGDYDTDGVTSSALLTLALRAASGGAQPVAVRLPRRREGYGLSEAGVEDLAAAGARLLVAVDCGSKDHAAVERARQLGMDVVVLDHHRITDPPPAHAIVASAQLREDAPYTTVSAAGVAYLLATALARDGFDTGGGVGEEPTGLLDLAMIGLVGDVSSLSGVNRALVRDGLRRLRQDPRPGLRALCDCAGIDATDVDEHRDRLPGVAAPQCAGPPRRSATGVRAAHHSRPEAGRAACRAGRASESAPQTAPGSHPARDRQRAGGQPEQIGSPRARLCRVGLAAGDRRTCGEQAGRALRPAGDRADRQRWSRARVGPVGAGLRHHQRAVGCQVPC